MNFGAELLSDKVIETGGGGQLDRERLVPFHNREEKRDDVVSRI